MMKFKKHLLAISAMALGIQVSVAQPTSADEIEYIVTALNGTVINATNNEPVTAFIKYESLPYGNKVGVFSGNDFKLNLEGKNDYLLVVEAQGFVTHRETVKVTEASDGQIMKTIGLVPVGYRELIRLDKLIFALGKAQITSESYGELDNLVGMLEENRAMIIQLEGHTDFRGNAKQNMALSEKRVEAVKDYLVDKGIDKKRIKTKAFGGTQPLSRNSEDAAANRRVEVRILQD